jgi:hypothetical protein
METNFPCIIHNPSLMKSSLKYHMCEETEPGLLQYHIAPVHWKVLGSALPSATANLCFKVFAFLLMPLRRFVGGPSAVETGVAAPDGFAETSSKCPSPI